MKKSHVAALLIFLIAIPVTLVLGLQLPQVHMVAAIEIVIRMVLFWLRYKSGKWKTAMKAVA